MLCFRLLLCLAFADVGYFRNANIQLKRESEADDRLFVKLLKIIFKHPQVSKCTVAFLKENSTVFKLGVIHKEVTIPQQIVHLNVSVTFMRSVPVTPQRS